MSAAKSQVVGAKIPARLYCGLRRNCSRSMTQPDSLPKPPRILFLHNRYRQPGGEDVMVQAQAQLLRDRGHEVRLIEKDNREIDGYGLFKKIGLFFKTADNIAAAVEVARIVEDFKPQV